MYGGVIAPPLIIGGAAGLTGPQIGAARLGCAASSAAWRRSCRASASRSSARKLPLVQGISFASVSTMTRDRHRRRRAAGRLRRRSSWPGCVGLAISPFFAQVVRFFPPVVNGTIITVIGLSLLPVAVRLGHGRQRPQGAGLRLDVGNIGLGRVHACSSSCCSPRCCRARSAGCRSCSGSSSARSCRTGRRQGRLLRGGDRQLGRLPDAVPLRRPGLPGRPRSSR